MSYTAGTSPRELANKGTNKVKSQVHALSVGTPFLSQSNPLREKLRQRAEFRAAVGMLSLVAAFGGSFGTTSTNAVTVTPLGTGQLPSGNVIVMTQLTLDPGDKVAWHFHPGTGLRVVLSGTLTEDEGCGTPLVEHLAGSAFEEEPGKVHQIFNLGTDPVVVLRTDILPPCYEHQGTIFVSGPRCEGDSGRSHLEQIAPCTSETGSLEPAKSNELTGGSRSITLPNREASTPTGGTIVGSVDARMTAFVALLRLAPADPSWNTR